MYISYLINTSINMYKVRKIVSSNAPNGLWRKAISNNYYEFTAGKNKKCNRVLKLHFTQQYTFGKTDTLTDWCWNKFLRFINNKIILRTATFFFFVERKSAYWLMVWKDSIKFDSVIKHDCRQYGSDERTNTSNSNE